MTLRPHLLAGMLAVAIALAAQTTGHAQGTPPGINPTHYWSYQLMQPFQRPDHIDASDQFLPFTPFDIDRLDRLVNWVHKVDPSGLVSPVPDTTLHYTWWNIINKLPFQTTVIVQNQFGRYPVTVQNVEFLLSPAYKNFTQATAPFPVANHYLCYRAQGFPSPGLVYPVSDEWRQSQVFPQPMQFLCVPCMKHHNGTIYPIVDGATHLAVYPIDADTGSEFWLPFISDQFVATNHPVWQKPFEYLFVPSTKTDISTPTHRNTWGTIKTLYR